jgi:hypothetical protein
MKENDMLIADVPLEVLLTCQRQAKLSTIGGKSNIYSRMERLQMCAENQITGHLGEAMNSLFWFGSLQPYLVSRWYANSQPLKGDEGIDVPGSNIDVKRTCWRTETNALDHHLWVRKHEFHYDRLYSFALAIRNSVAESGWTIVVGWASASELRPPKPGEDRYELEAFKLNKMPPIDWTLNDGPHWRRPCDFK